MCLLNHDFIAFSGKPQKSEFSLPERKIILLFTFFNMSTAELFDKKIVSELVLRNDKIMTNYKMKTLLEFCPMSLKNAYCEFWKKNL